MARRHNALAREQELFSDGFVADVEVLHTMGDTLANSTAWPNWHKDSEFRAARDKVMGHK